MILLLLDPKYPKNSPARFACRIASFPYDFTVFGSQNTLKIPARFARRIASFPYSFAALGRIPYVFPMDPYRLPMDPLYKIVI